MTDMQDRDDTLAPNEVRLSTGQLMRLRDPDPAAERRSDIFALSAGMRRGLPDPVELANLRALLAVEAIDGQAVPWPPVPPRRAAVCAWLRSFSRDDLNLLAACYVTVYEGKFVPFLRLGRR